MLNTTYTSNSIINLDYSCIKPWIQIQEKESEMAKNLISFKKLTECISRDAPAGSGSTTASTNAVHIGLPITSKENVTEDDVVTDNVISVGNNTIRTDNDTNEQDDNEVFILNVNADEIPILGTLSDERRNEIAIQCHNLLQNLSQLSPGFVTDESLERLKSDLQASIGVLKMEPETKTLASEDETFSATEQTIVSETETFATSNYRNMDNQKRAICIYYDESGVKRQKFDENDSSIESLVDDSISDDEGINALINEGANIEEETVETVEIVTEGENEGRGIPDLGTTKAGSRTFSNDDETIKVVSSETNSQELSSEQRERQLLAILTANVT